MQGGDEVMELGRGLSLQLLVQHPAHGAQREGQSLRPDGLRPCTGDEAACRVDLEHVVIVHVKAVAVHDALGAAPVEDGDLVAILRQLVPGPGSADDGVRHTNDLAHGVGDFLRPGHYVGHGPRLRPARVRRPLGAHELPAVHVVLHKLREATTVFGLDCVDDIRHAHILDDFRNRWRLRGGDDARRGLMLGRPVVVVVPRKLAGDSGREAVHHLPDRTPRTEGIRAADAAPAAGEPGPQPRARAHAREGAVCRAALGVPARGRAVAAGGARAGRGRDGQVSVDGARRVAVALRVAEHLAEA
mmetsp:Transcript_76320/g.220524  ORF Transcript_76320/g.220524 Transcript_76320/m.220524 type:complete len:302 (-) Transcript_76320:292-1197(-)